MDTYFKIILIGVVEQAAIHYLKMIEAYNAPTITDRGRDKQQAKYTPKKNAAKIRVNELLELNYPEFSGRFISVDWLGRNSQSSRHVTVSVNRTMPESDDSNPFR